MNIPLLRCEIFFYVLKVYIFDDGKQTITTRNVNNRKGNKMAKHPKQ